jgi:ABC-2 type transport system ATP-binding protein
MSNPKPGAPTPQARMRMDDDRAARDAGSPLLQAIEFTSRHYGDLLVLDVLSLEVAHGEIYCLLGAAGAGKTAVLHAFLGLLRPTVGQALVAGINPAKDPIAARRHITYIGRGASLYGTLTARQNLEFFVRVDGGSRGLTRTDYYNAMRRVGIPERAFERPARQLGSAVALLIWLAVGLLKNTSVLLIDEPTVGLDLYASADLQETLVEFRERGQALLIATSDVLFAGHVATRIGILKEGRKTIELTQQELMERPLHDLYLEYMGRPPAKDLSPAGVPRRSVPAHPELRR